MILMMFGDYVSSSDVSMESVQDEETHSEQMPEVDEIGEDIEADQNKQFHCDQCHCQKDRWIGRQTERQMMTILRK